ncbi:MAG: type II toxin-antitoxin system VapC family toxin [Polyangia bacterium]|jgi:predicted nucleic acid-binding protein|nr:type II toxin-antitoxin system VapC family toxin [Polyangia bacterium]
MPFVVDATVAVRWFVPQEGHEAAKEWLHRLKVDPLLLVAPDLLRFEVFGVLARLQPRKDQAWADRCFGRLDALGIRTLPTTMPLYSRAFELARTLSISGWDAVYLAHAEQLGAAWLTADRKVLRRLGDDPRIQAL